jgi:hypothetical protein
LSSYHKVCSHRLSASSNKKRFDLENTPSTIPLFSRIKQHSHHFTCKPLENWFFIRPRSFWAERWTKLHLYPWLYTSRDDFFPSVQIELEVELYTIFAWVSCHRSLEHTQWSCLDPKTRGLFSVLQHYSRPSYPATTTCCSRTAVHCNSR